MVCVCVCVGKWERYLDGDRMKKEIGGLELCPQQSVPLGRESCCGVLSGSLDGAQDTNTKVQL